jgi:hypothetical protein
LGTLTIDYSLKPLFDQRWSEYARRKAKEAGISAAIITYPPMAGPGPDGRVTFVQVPSEFLVELRESQIDSSSE